MRFSRGKACICATDTANALPHSRPKIARFLLFPFLIETSRFARPTMALL
jgi:hypothetical protein